MGSFVHAQRSGIITLFSCCAADARYKTSVGLHLTRIIKPDFNAAWDKNSLSIHLSFLKSCGRYGGRTDVDQHVRERESNRYLKKIHTC